MRSSMMMKCERLSSIAGVADVKMSCSAEAPEPCDSRATAESPASTQTKITFPGCNSGGTAAAASKACSRKRKVGSAYCIYCTQA